MELLLKAAIVFAIHLMDSTNRGLPYDQAIVTDTVRAVVSVTQDVAEVETLIKIARYESGGFRKDVALCKVKGDNGMAHGLFQVHPWSRQEAKDLCDPDFKKQAAIALARVRESRKMCKRLGYKNSDLLTGYTKGHCIKQGKAAKLRWGSGKAIQKIVDEYENERLAATGSED